MISDRLDKNALILILNENNKISTDYLWMQFEEFERRKHVYDKAKTQDVASTARIAA